MIAKMNFQKERETIIQIQDEISKKENKTFEYMGIFMAIITFLFAKHPSILIQNIIHPRSFVEYRNIRDNSHYISSNFKGISIAF